MWTYNPTMLTSRDKVRFLVGDTDVAEQLLQDEEIDFLLTQDGDYRSAAATACEAIAARFARKVQRSIGDLSINAQQRYEHYKELASRLRSTIFVAPYAGGISISDKEAQEDNTDRVKPAFTRSMMQYDEDD